MAESTATTAVATAAVAAATAIVTTVTVAATSTATSFVVAWGQYLCAGVIKVASTFMVASFGVTIIVITKAITEVVAAKLFVIFPFLSTTVSV